MSQECRKAISEFSGSRARRRSKEEDEPDGLAHFDLLESAALGGRVGIEFDARFPLRAGPEHADRHRHDRVARAKPSAARRRHLDASFPPADALDRGGEPDAAAFRIEPRPQPVDDPAVARDDAELHPILGRGPRFSPRRERVLARPLENRGVVALEHRGGESLFRRRHPAARPEELRNRSIAAPCPHLPRHRVEPCPEIVLPTESGRGCLETGIGETVDQHTRFAGDFEDLVAPAVNELGAELDWKRPATDASREDPPARPGAGLEDGDREPGGREPLRGGETRRAGADDDDVQRAFGHRNP